MVFIKHNCPSSKNSKQRTAKGFMIMSKTVTKFLRSHGIKSYSSRKKTVDLYKTIPMTFPVEELKWLLKGHEYPVVLGFHFVRGTRHHADFGNLQQIIADLLVAFEIIPDDDMNHFFAVPFKIDGEYFSYNKDAPGVYIKVLESKSWKIINEKKGDIL